MYSIVMSFHRASSSPSLSASVWQDRLPDHLRQVVWTGRGVTASSMRTLPSGHAALDRVLPGGGWPIGSLTEILPVQPGLGEWRLLGPALSTQVGIDAPMLLVNPPHEPGLLGLEAWRVPAEAVHWAQASTQADSLWTIDQALKADCFMAILAWLPHVPVQALRRLHAVAAHHGGLFYGFREPQAADMASPAPLRLRLSLGACPHPLNIQVLKRRGSPWAQPVVLPIWPEPLSDLLPVSLPHITSPQGAPHAALDRARIQQPAWAAS